MENISKINIKGTEYQIQDSALTNQVNLLDERVAKIEDEYANEPLDGKTYSRKNGEWVESAGVFDSNLHSAIFNNYDNNTAIGKYSHIEGTSSEKAYKEEEMPSDIQQIMMDWYMSMTGFSMSYGEASHVEGKDCLATGDFAHAEGLKTLAANDGSHAEGNGTNAAGIYAHAEGLNTTAYAQACHSEGSMCVCNGNYGHTEGFRTTVENTGGHAEGYITYCRSNYGHSEGRQTNSIGSSSHIEGYGKKTDRSITIKTISNQVGLPSHFTSDNKTDIQLGCCLIIDNIPYIVTDIQSEEIFVDRWIEFETKKYDISIMYGVAYGDNSHAEGEYCTTIGQNTHASGLNCFAFSDNEFACGRYNFSHFAPEDSEKIMFSVGNGTSNTNRSNIIEMKHNGDIYIMNIGGYNGKNSSESKPIQQVISELTEQIQNLQAQLN